MTIKQRDENLIEVLYLMKWCADLTLRSRLQQIGESLVTEYLDMNARKVSAAIQELRRGCM